MDDHAIRTIIVPTDCSALSLNALRYADRLASRSGAEVIAVYGAVFESPDGEGVAASLVSPEDREMMMAPVRRCIEESLAHTLSAVTKREILLEDCEAADAIVSAAHARNADLIIIGTHDRNRLMRAVLGSVTDAVLRLARCPVLVLREHNRVGGIARIVSESAASDQAQRIADAAGAEVVVRDAVSGEEQADLIVVTSASSQIVRTAPCPVLVVKR